jgi:organic hydroperoxide reductase OsmC/OhrA
MGGRVHVYEASIIWTENRGQGTSAHKNYDHDHMLRVAGKPQLQMSSDPAFLGDPARYNPKELLVTAISSCHVLWYLHLCVESRVVVAAYEDCASGRLIVSTEDGGHFESVTLRPNVTIEAGETEAARRLHDCAHKKCFIASSVNFPVFLEATILRAPLGLGPIPAGLSCWS